MKVSLGQHKRKHVYDVLFGSKRVQRIMYGGKQIWPDVSGRVATLSIDMSTLDGTLDGAYWLHALEAVASGSNKDCYVKLRAGGRDYLLQTTYGTWKKAMYNAGVVDFLGNGPASKSLQVGDTVEVTMVVPEITTSSIGGDKENYTKSARWNYKNGRYVTGQYPPTIPNTSVHGFFRLKNIFAYTGNRIIVQASDESVLLDKSKQRTGRNKTVDLDWGTVGFKQGSTHVTLKVIPNKAYGEWGGYFVYPEFTRTIQLKVADLTYRRAV